LCRCCADRQDASTGCWPPAWIGDCCKPQHPWLCSRNKQQHWRLLLCHVGFMRGEMVVLGRVAPVSPPSSAIMAGYDSEDYSTEARRSCWTPEVGGGHAGPPVSPCRPGMCVSVFGAAAGGGQAPQLAGGCAMAQRKGRALGVAVVPPPPTCRLPVLVEVCPGVLSAPRGREAVVEGHGCGQIPAACVPGSLAPPQPARARTWWANESARGVFGCFRHAALPRPPYFARSEPAVDQEGHV
jgi:hypothetical protein